MNASQKDEYSSPVVLLLWAQGLGAGD